MRAVTIGTGCRHDETRIDQGPTMDAIFIAAHDVIHFGVNPCRRLFADAMTLSAELGDVTRIARLPGKFIIECRVFGMTVLASRCVRIVLRMQGSVRTALVLGDLFGVADAAVHL